MSSEVAQKVFSHIPDGWDCARLIDCTTDGNISYGIVQPGQHTDDGIPIIRVNNVNNGQLDLNDVLRVAPEIEEKYKRTRLIGGEVLLTLVGSTGQSFVAPPQLAGWNVPRAIAVIRPKVEIGADWINICLQSKPVQRFLDVRANTTVQKTLNLKDVKDIPIPLPPEGIKEKIESIAVSLQGKNELNRLINQTLEHIAQAIFESWFVDFEPVKAKIQAKQNGQDPERAAMCAISGKTDAELDAFLEVSTPEQRQQLTAAAALFPNELEDSGFGEIPKGWVVTNLGEYADFQNGYAFKSKDWQEKGLPVVKIGSVKPGLVDLSRCSYVSEETVVALEQYRLSPGDLLVGMTGYPGETGLVPFGNRSPYLNQRVGRVSPAAGRPELYTWIYANLRNPGFKAYAEARAHGSAQANVSGKSLMEYPVCYPGKDMISLYHEKIYPLVALSLKNSNQSSNLSMLRDVLLPKLLSGVIDVNTATET